MRLWKSWVALCAAVVMSACGGGGSDAGEAPFGPGSGSPGSGTGGGATTGEPSISLALSSTTVSGATPATVSAVVRDATGSGVAGQVVQFSTSGGLGAFSAPSALTDASGRASVSLQPATGATTGADTVVATTSLNGSTVTAQTGFQLTATQVSISDFSSDVAQLAAHGQANLTVALAGTSPGIPVNVAVTSACVAKGKATLTPANATTSNGTATFTYRDQGCGATDVSDVVQASVTGTSATASIKLTLTSPAVASIAFVSANPTTIFLKGSGLNESSVVTFQVRDANATGLANKSLQLELVSAAGGVTIDDGAGPVEKVSDSDGNVIVRINSGTIPTPVRVRATLVGSNIATVSSELAVAVGLPSQLNFSLSQTTKNIEGYVIDGTPNGYHIIASDRLGNPVPDGTAINFITEGGQVEAIKFTALTNGHARATASFVSAEPRPVDGRVTILAYSLGEESFLDQDGDNVFDADEPFQDLGNLFLSRSLNLAGGYISTDDQFISLSISGSSACTGVDPLKDPGDLLSRGLDIPSIPGTCDGGWGRAYVRRAIETVFSTSSARPLWASKPSNLYGATCPTVTLQDAYPENVDEAKDAQAALRDGNPNLLPASMRDVYYRVGGGGALFSLGTQGTVSFILADANPFRLNPMPAGTTVSVATTDGMTASVSGGSPVPSMLEAGFVSVNYKFEEATSGTITLNVKAPSGLTTSIDLPVHMGAPVGQQCP